MTEIEFQNGSKITALKSSGKTVRGKVRGYVNGNGEKIRFRGGAFMRKFIKNTLKSIWSYKLLIASGCFIILGFLEEDFLYQILYCLYAMGFLIMDECKDIKKKLDEMIDDHTRSDTAVVEIISGTTDILKKIIKQNKEAK